MTMPEEIEERCRSIGTLLGDALPPGVGFVFALFDFGGPGSMSYISNGDRDGIIKMLAELRQKLIEGRR